MYTGSPIYQHRSYSQSSHFFSNLIEEHEKNYPHYHTKNCRYAFNGMEQDKEVSGNGNSYTTQFRQYDPRLGRWKSLDPLAAKFPSMNPYIAFNNNPIYFIDPSGLEGTTPGDKKKTHKGKHPRKKGEDGLSQRDKDRDEVSSITEAYDGQTMTYEYTNRPTSTGAGTTDIVYEYTYDAKSESWTVATYQVIEGKKVSKGVDMDLAPKKSVTVLSVPDPPVHSEPDKPKDAGVKTNNSGTVNKKVEGSGSGDGKDLSSKNNKGIQRNIGRYQDPKDKLLTFNFETYESSTDDINKKILADNIAIVVDAYNRSKDKSNFHVRVETGVNAPGASGRDRNKAVVGGSGEFSGQKLTVLSAARSKYIIGELNKAGLPTSNIHSWYSNTWYTGASGRIVINPSDLKKDPGK